MQALGQVWGRVDPRAPDLKETATRLAAPELYGAQILLDAWRAPDDGFTVGRDIPSRALSPILRNIAVFEPLEDRADFRVRIAGTALLRRFGGDIKGARMTGLYAPATFQRRRQWLIEALDGGKPVDHQIVMQQGDRRPLGFELVYVPALSPDRRQQWVIAGFFYYED